jgi:hypothetical protein
VVIDGLHRVSIPLEPADDDGREINPPACGVVVSVSLDGSWRLAPGRRTRPLAQRIS